MGSDNSHYCCHHHHHHRTNSNGIPSSERRRQDNPSDDDDNSNSGAEDSYFEADMSPLVEDEPSMAFEPDLEHAAKARKVLKKRCWREGKARYAAKQLREDILLLLGNNPQNSDNNSDEDMQQLYNIGLADLAMEARLLASLSHPNICKLRGTAGIPGQPDYMLLLDRLYLTLDDQIVKWREALPPPGGRRHHTSAWFDGVWTSVTKKLSGHRRSSSEGNASLDLSRRSKHTVLLQKGQLLHRLYAAYDVARALKYLHAHNIVFRDLKPQVRSR